MDQEHRITYKAGITRTPSDFLCADGDLAECINLTSDSEELKPVVQPAEHITRYVGIMGNHTPEILYVHKVMNQENYIGYLPTNNNKLCFGTVENKVYANLATYDFAWQPGTSKITSIGKTLIISDSNGLHCLIWYESLYTNLGAENIPHLNASAHLYFDPSPGPKATQHWVRNSGNLTDIIDLNPDAPSMRIHENAQEEYNDYVLGLYAKNKRAVGNKKGFIEPFFIRLALELFDGSYTYVTNPVLMLPSVKGNTYIDWFYGAGDNRVSVVTDFCHLFVTQDIDYSQFSDVVKDVVLFATDGIPLYDTTIDQELHWGRTNDVCFAGFWWGRATGNQQTIYERSAFQSRTGGGCLVERKTEDVENDIESASVFYKIASLGLKPFSGNVASKIGDHVLENITTQDRLEYDDFYSRCSMSAEVLYAYNSRLNIANVQRGFFGGFDFFWAVDDETPHSYDFYVTIKAEDNTVVVHHHKDNCYQQQGYYFYYPDSRATNVVIYQDGNTKILDAKLKEHNGLNGAYYFAGLPVATYNGGVTMPDREVNAGGSTNVSTNPKEKLVNYIITSEVSNPWVFNANGYNKVGTGKIIGLSETTMALSQDAYGHNDLVVFSESGIWGMAVDETGLFQSIHPFTRDVCINPNSITKVDWGVFFVSKKGLMLLTDQGVTCVSERMNGQTFNTASLSPLATGTDWASLVATCQGDTSFLDYIRDSRCFLAYDYIDSRVLVINPGYGYGYIYNMKDATISKTVLPQVMRGVVGNYPDNMLLGGSYVYSFYGKQREEEVSTRQLAFLLTRPMKLAGPVSKASLRQLMNVGMWDKKNGSMVKTEIYLSDDLHKWYEDVSRFGAAAKYYRLALFIKMRPTERLSGTILTEQPRRTDNMK